MVALRTPEQLQPPPRDGYLVDRGSPAVASEIGCWIRYRSALAQAPTGDAVLVTLDLAAGSGVIRHALEGELRWSASLLALQLCPPDHTYVLHAGTKERAEALIARARAAAPCGSAVFEVALDEAAYLARARDLSRVVVALGPKVVVTHGDAERLVFVLNELFPQSWRRRLILRAGSISTATWPTIVGIVDAERSIDVVVTMPPCLSDQETLAAALLGEQQSEALTSFFGTPSWRLLVETQPSGLADCCELSTRSGCAKSLAFASQTTPANCRIGLLRGARSSPRLTTSAQSFGRRLAGRCRTPRTSFTWTRLRLRSPSGLRRAPLLQIDVAVVGVFADAAPVALLHCGERLYSR